MKVGREKDIIELVETSRYAILLKEDVEELSCHLERHKLQQLLPHHNVHLADEGGVGSWPVHRHTLLQLGDKVLIQGYVPHRVKP